MQPETDTRTDRRQTAGERLPREGWSDRQTPGQRRVRAGQAGWQANGGQLSGQVGVRTDSAWQPAPAFHKGCSAGGLLQPERGPGPRPGGRVFTEFFFLQEEAAVNSLAAVPAARPPWQPWRYAAPRSARGAHPPCPRTWCLLGRPRPPLVPAKPTAGLREEGDSVEPWSQPQPPRHPRDRGHWGVRGTEARLKGARDRQRGDPRPSHSGPGFKSHSATAWLEDGVRTERGGEWYPGGCWALEGQASSRAAHALDCKVPVR